MGTGRAVQGRAGEGARREGEGEGARRAGGCRREGVRVSAGEGPGASGGAVSASESAVVSQYDSGAFRSIFT